MSCAGGIRCCLPALGRVVRLKRFEREHRILHGRDPHRICSTTTIVAPIVKRFIIVFDKLHELCRALTAGDAQTALQLHMQLMESDWAGGNGAWMPGVKRLIEVTSKLGVTL